MKSFVRLVLPVVLLSSIAAAALPRDFNHGPNKRHQTVPDGGSAVVYLVLGATVCLGAIAVRRKRWNSADHQL